MGTYDLYQEQSVGSCALPCGERLVLPLTGLVLGTLG